MQFAALQSETMLNIVDKFIKELEMLLTEQKVILKLSDKVRNWLAEKGYDPLQGARPLTRVIQENIKKPLAEEVLFGKLQNGGEVVAKIAEDKLLIEVELENIIPIRIHNMARKKQWVYSPEKIAVKSS